MEAENIIEANEQLAQRVAQLTEENKGLLDQLDERKAQLTAYEADYDELVLENQKLKAENNSEDKEEVDAEYDEDAEDEDEEAVEAQEAVDPVQEQAKANADIILKQLGATEAISQPSQEVEFTREQALEEYGKLADSNERSHFYAKHRDLLFNN